MMQPHNHKFECSVYDKLETDGSSPVKSISLTQSQSVQKTEVKPNSTFSNVAKPGITPSTSSNVAEVLPSTQVTVTSVEVAKKEATAVSVTTSKPHASSEFVRVKRCDWDLLIAKAQKADRSKIADLQLCISLQEKDKEIKTLRETVKEYEKAYLRSERNFADILCTQGFALPQCAVKSKSSFKTRKSRSEAAKDATSSSTDVSNEASKVKSERTDEGSRLEQNQISTEKKQSVELENDGSEIKTAEESGNISIPPLEELLRNSSRPDAFYTSWKISSNVPKTGVARSTFESLAQDYSNLKLQMNKLSSEKGFDLKTNMELQESIRLLQGLLEEKDAIFQQQKIKLTKAIELLKQKEKLIATYSIECGKLQSENAELKKIKEQFVKSSNEGGEVSNKSSTESDLQLNVNNLSSELQTLQVKFDDLSAKYQAGETLKNQLIGRVKDGEEERKRLLCEIEAMKQESKKIFQEYQGVFNEKLAYEEQVRLFNDDYQKLKDDLRMETHHKEKLVATYQEQIRKLTDQIKKQDEQITYWKKVYDDERKKMSQTQIGMTASHSASSFPCGMDEKRYLSFPHQRLIHVDAPGNVPPYNASKPDSSSKNSSQQTANPVEASSKPMTSMPDSGFSSHNSASNSSSRPFSRSKLSPSSSQASVSVSRTSSESSGSWSTSSTQISEYKCENCEQKFSNKKEFTEHTDNCQVD